MSVNCGLSARVRLLAGLLASSVLAVPAGAETLQDALVKAYATNPTFLAEQARLRATDEGVASALSGWRPTVTVNGSYTVTDQDVKSQSIIVSQGNSGGSNTISGSVTATQTLFNGFQTYNNVRRARANVDAGRGVLAQTEQQVLLLAVTAYVDVQRDEAVVRLSENNVQVLARQLEAAQDRFRVGEITRTDVAQAEARLEASKSNLAAAQAQLTASRAAYERTIGNPPLGLEPPPPLPNLPATFEEAQTRAEDSNPTLRSAIATERASRFQVYSSTGDLLPTLSIQGRLSDNENTGLRRGQTGTQSAVAQLTVPIYQGGAEYAAIRQAKETNSRDRIRVAETQRSVAEDAANAWEGLRSARARIISTTEQVRASEIAFEGVQQEAMVGSRTTLDVLDAEQELLDARVSLVRAQRDEYVAAFQLLSVVGGLNAAGLGLPVEVYDPADHYGDVWWLPIGF